MSDNIIDLSCCPACGKRLVDFLLKSLQGERIDAPWPCVFAGPAEMVGLGRRIGAVEKAFHDALKKRLSRVARLATADAPRGVVPCSRGLWVWFADFGRLWVSREAMVNGHRLNFLADLRTWNHFGRGWARRIASNLLGA